MGLKTETKLKYLPDMLCYQSICGACGNPKVLNCLYYNEEKKIETKLCKLCSQTAKLNGYHKKEG